MSNKSAFNGFFASFGASSSSPGRFEVLESEEPIEEKIPQIESKFISLMWRVHLCGKPDGGNKGVRETQKTSQREDILFMIGMCITVEIKMMVYLYRSRNNV